ncbi:MAG: hypothetical protein IT426_14225 [Pirellulales bacterium]|nr:hypothetical protein [Pirellulales bacterium]
MARRFFTSALPIFGILLLAASLATAAEDFLKLVPDSAWGFAAVNRPADVNAKAQTLGREMQLPVPDLMAMFKKQSAIEQGIDEQGTTAFLVLAPENESATPSPILLIPVTDYAKFLAQMTPESKTEDVTEVSFFGSPSLVRRIGGYAALTGLKYRKSLESLELSGEVPAALKPWGEWISARDIAGVLLQPGIKTLSAKGQTWLSIMKMKLGQAGEQGKQAVAAFELYEKMLQAAEKEISACGIGLALDGQNVLRVTSRTEMLPAGEWGKFLAQVPPAKENLLAGLPGEPFVVAGGGVLSEAMMEGMMQFSLNLMKAAPGMYGLGEEQIAKMSKLSMSNFKGVRSMSMSLGVGKGGEPLYANLLGTMRVDDAETLIAGYEQYFRQYNEVLQGAKSSMMPPMAAEKCEIAGKPALQIKMDLPKPQAAPMPPQYDKMMEAMLGPGGKMTFWIAPADEHTVALGYVNKEPLERMIAAIREKKSDLMGDADCSKTAALLPPDAPMVGYLSPQGTVELVKRMVSDFLPPGMAERVEIPDFPQTPPLGFAVKTAPNELQSTLAVPAEVLQAVGKYIQHIRGMSREDVTMNR